MTTAKRSPAEIVARTIQVIDGSACAGCDVQVVLPYDWKLIQEDLAELLALYEATQQERELIASQTLALLVMDLGYGTDDKFEPTYNHDPLRHQRAWSLAQQALGPDVSRAVATMRAQLEQEGGPDPDRQEQINVLMHQTDAMKARAEAAESALREGQEFLEHRLSCPALDSSGYACSCGYEAYLRRLEDVIRRSEEDHTRHVDAS